MGQTLTHGIYLPDEGERNCYDGLAANWQLLDGAVGTVAEHSTQIAGKAPLVHTHTKSDITDFPALANVATSGSYNDLSNIPASFTPASHSHGNITNDGKVGTTANVPLITGTDGVIQAGSFGNAANTFCEGNDSRLSDARTPVAHTHVTADVTDLLNTAHTWSGEQTFSQTIQGNAATASAFDTAKSITLTGAVTGTVSGTNSWEIATVLKTGSARTGGTVTNPYFKIASWEVAPNKYFGAILQIQNKCYPHNVGTLIISVRTNSDSTFQRGYSILNDTMGVAPSEYILCYKEVTGKLLCELYFYTTVTFNGIRFSVISEGTGIQNDNSLFNIMVVYQDPAGIAALPSDYTVIQTTIGTYTQDFIPGTTNAYNLGTSTNKWKSFNGANPGALSLPVTALNNTYDISGNITDLTGGNNSITAARTGWIFVKSDNATEISIENTTTGMGASDHSASATTLMVSIPVTSGETLNIIANCTSIDKAYLLPCQGNV